MPPSPTYPSHTADRIYLLGVAGLVVAAFGPTWVELGRYWAEQPEYSHGFLLPPVAAWMLWVRRQELREAGTSPSWLGALLLLPCLAVLLLGEMRLSWYLKPYAFVGAVGMLVWALFGMRALRISFLPLVVLFLMCPLPGRIRDAMTVPLKHTAAVFAAGLLDVLGYQVSLDGNLIRMPGLRDLWVADACSGIRSLISLVTLAVLACMSWQRVWPLRVLVVLSAIPIALFVNGLRICATGVLAAKYGSDAAEGFFHLFEGVLLFSVAGLLLWGWASLLGRLFPRGADMIWLLRIGVVLALGTTALQVHRVRSQLAVRGGDPTLVARLAEGLRSIPLDLEGGRYVGSPHVLDDQIVAMAGADAFLSTEYQKKGGQAFQLYVGGSISNEENFHTPRFCMPAAGWEVVHESSAPFVAYPVPDRDPRMRRLVLQFGQRRMVVYYWFQAGDRLSDHEWSVRYARLKDLLAGRPMRPTVVVTLYAPVPADLETTEREASEFLRILGPYLHAALSR